jgi:hypothetical protein
MKKQYPHTEAANFLTSHALPSEAELDAMNPAELASFLSSQGVNVVKLQGEIGQLQKQLSGRLALASARKQRLAKASTVEADLSAMSQDDIVAALVKKFGRVEDIPLAARNFKAMNREDWESLYRDYFEK